MNKFKSIFLGTLLALSLTTACYAGTDVHGGSVTIAEDLTVSNNLSVANASSFNTVTIAGTLNVTGTLTGQTVVQRVVTQTTASQVVASTNVPEDDTIPQASEAKILTNLDKWKSRLF